MGFVFDGGHVGSGCSIGAGMRYLHFMMSHNPDVLVSVENCAFVPVSKIVPRETHEWFFEALSENVSFSSPYSWGDNDRTMISAPRFLIRALEVLEGREGVGREELEEQLARSMEALEKENILIDLES